MFEVILPQLGQSVEEAEITAWLKAEGEVVSAGEPLFTVQTDKAEIEVEAPDSGVLRKVLVTVDIEVPVLTVVALIGDNDEPLPDLSQFTVAGGTATAIAPEAAAEVKTEAPTIVTATVPEVSMGNGHGKMSPRAGRVADAHHVDSSCLAGSGPAGRIVEDDVLNYVTALYAVKMTPVARRIAGNAGLDVARLQQQSGGKKLRKAQVLELIASGVPASPAMAAEVQALSPMRRVIAERMCASKFSAPHYYVTVDIDMSASKAYRTELPYKVSYNDLVLYAAAQALKAYPSVNARWTQSGIEQVSEINLGMAVALPEGLIVPVIKGAQNLSLQALSTEAKALAEKAQTGKLMPDDYTGNTFTVSNLGAFGVESFTAIINQPDSAILAVGQMKDKPIVTDGSIFIRPMMKITISSDHRVIDGSVAGQFMAKLKEVLETAAFSAA